jgi:type VI secretion system secreted protein VgrG
MTFGGLAALAATTVNLATASSFAVLAATTVTNTGSSTISGDLGVDPGSAVTGSPLVEPPYSTFTADSVALGAQNDLTTAYNQAATAEGPPTFSQHGVDLGGLTLTGGGVYQSTSDGSLNIGVGETLTLSGGGVFIFQTGASQTLITSTTSNVVLDGVSPCNVFWQIGSSATLNGPTFAGTVMASTSITVGSDVTVDGRLLASSGDVTLQSDTINASTCITGSLPTPTATPTATATPTPTPTAGPTVPASGAGGTSSSAGVGVLLTLGGLALLGAGVATGAIRRRRFPSV